MVGRPEESVEGRRTSGSTGRRLTASAFVVAGILFLLYPAIRPFSDEVTLSGAAAFASPAWVFAHSLAMAGFVLLVLGLFGLYAQMRGTRGARLALPALLLSWVGAGLTLPYYGAETFGLHAVGQQALLRHDAALLSMAHSIRFEQSIWFIVLGLAAVGAGSILVAVAVWRSGRGPTWSGVPLAVALALYLPQFATPQPVRVAHGLLMLTGCVLLARAISRSGSETPSERARLATS
jgi:hypothetical protein